MNDMIFPEPLKRGDKIAFISPATTVEKRFVDGAVDFLCDRGYQPCVLPYVNGPASGSFASSLPNRIADFREALLNPEYKAIFCARGGYGSIHILPHVSFEEVHNNPKWIIGFSDISAFHALWLKSGVASIHASMAKHLAEKEHNPKTIAELFHILEKAPEFDYRFEASPFNIKGTATGQLRGGNLAVLNSLADTPFDILHVDENEQTILFLEDVSEAIYAVERMLTRLILGGNIQRLRGLIIGQFTKYNPDKNYQSMEEMISALLETYDIKNLPVAFNIPVGHIRENYPMIEGARVELSVGDEVRLSTRI